MKKTIHTTSFSSMPTDYLGLCHLYLPRPIRDRIDYENITEITDAMAGHELTKDQEDYFDLLCRLIEDYEREQIENNSSKTTATSIEVLKHLLDEQNKNAAFLSELLGVHRTLGGMILRGERNLTINHVRTLSRYFKVSTDLFVCP